MKDLTAIRMRPGRGVGLDAGCASARLCALLLTAFLPLPATAGAPEADIVDVFNARNNRTCFHHACDMNYFIERRGDDHANGYAVQKKSYQSVYEIVVDLPRHYLRLGDEGTGGGNAVVTAVLFHPQKGKPLLLDTLNHYDGAALRRSSLAVHVFDKGRFEAAGHRFPRFRPIDFYRPGPVRHAARKPDQSAYVTEGQEDFIGFVLPQPGASLRVHLIQFDQAACVGNNWPGVPGPRREQACTTLSAQQAGARTIHFDRTSGRFRAGALEHGHSLPSEIRHD